MMRLHKIFSYASRLYPPTHNGNGSTRSNVDSLSYKTKDGPKRSETVTFGFPKEPKARYVNPSGIYPATPPVWQFIFSATPLN